MMKEPTDNSWKLDTSQATALARPVSGSNSAIKVPKDPDIRLDGEAMMKPDTAMSSSSSSGTRPTVRRGRRSWLARLFPFFLRPKFRDLIAAEFRRKNFPSVVDVLLLKDGRQFKVFIVHDSKSPDSMKDLDGIVHLIEGRQQVSDFDWVPDFSVGMIPHDTFSVFD